MDRTIKEVIATVQPQLKGPFRELVIAYYKQPDRIKALEDLDRGMVTLLIESGLYEHGLCFSYSVIKNSVFLRVMEVPDED